MPSLQRCMRTPSGPPVRLRTGRPNHKNEHRVFVLSADLISDAGDSPWLTKATPDAKKLEAGVEFLKMQRSGAANVLLGFDGCCRETRVELNKLPNAQEMFIVYSSSWNSWSNRHSFLSSSNCELGYVCLPVSRQRWVCKERPAGFNAAGEDTSHFTSMTGVGMTARTRLPRISVDEKAKVFGASGSLPPSESRTSLQVARCTGARPNLWLSGSSS